LQVEFNYELKSVLICEQPINSMTFKLIICQEPHQRPLQAKHRFFGNLGYETPVLDKGKQWKFDYTLNC
jgi:hypothetical protein